jgi:nicotinate-nucleotide pyrophosphorylase (carboxylating)
MMLNKIYVDRLIENALLEDINYVDAATDYLIPETQENSARFIAKADGVLAGLDTALRVFEILQPDFKAEVYKKDGDFLKKGDVIAEISGKTLTLLKG